MIIIIKKEKTSQGKYTVGIGEVKYDCKRTKKIKWKERKETAAWFDEVWPFVIYLIHSSLSGSESDVRSPFNLSMVRRVWVRTPFDIVIWKNGGEPKDEVRNQNGIYISCFFYDSYIWVLDGLLFMYGYLNKSNISLLLFTLGMQCEWIYLFLGSSGYICFRCVAFCTHRRRHKADGPSDIGMDEK